MVDRGAPEKPKKKVLQGGRYDLEAGKLRCTCIRREWKFCAHIKNLAGGKVTPNLLNTRPLGKAKARSGNLIDRQNLLHQVLGGAGGGGRDGAWGDGVVNKDDGVEYNEESGVNEANCGALDGIGETAKRQIMSARCEDDGIGVEYTWAEAMTNMMNGVGVMNDGNAFDGDEKEVGGVEKGDGCGVMQPSMHSTQQSKPSRTLESYGLKTNLEPNRPKTNNIFGSKPKKRKKCDQVK